MSETPDTSETNSVTPKLRVAFLIDRWDPQRGGAERAMAQLAEHLIARGHRVIAIALEHAADAPGEHVRVKSFGITRSMRERKLARNLVAAAHEHRADVTIGARHLWEVDLYWPHGGAHAVTQVAKRRAYGIPSWWPTLPRHRAFIEFERALLERGGARRVACVSKLVFDELAREYPACRARLELVENGVDLSRFHPAARATAGAALRRELGIDEQTPLITFAARNSTLKGFQPLMESLCALFLDGDTDWRLLIAGLPDRTELRKAGETRDVYSEPRTQLRPHVDGVALASASDLLVLPTYRDTSGLVILEALACGTPVVTTQCAGASTVIRADSGSVIERPDVFDSLELKNAIAKWLVRIRAGDIDRDAIRACVAERDSSTWLAKLEAIVVALAASKRAS